MISAKEARKLNKMFIDKRLKSFKETIHYEIKRAAEHGEIVAEVSFDINNEVELSRANKVKEELSRKGFVAEIYRNTNPSYYGQSGILRASW